MSIMINRKVARAYDISSYGTEHPDYVAIMVDKTEQPTYKDLFKHSDKLDPDFNDALGSKPCTTLNMCVPAIHVPDVTKALANDLIDKNTGKPSDLDYKVAEEVRNLADTILTEPDTILLRKHDLKQGDIIFPPDEALAQLGYTLHKSPNIKASQELVTNANTACRPDTKFEIPKASGIDWQDKNYKDLLDKLKDLMGKDIEPEKLQLSVSNEDLTERIINGHGTFDWIASSIFNQLVHAKNQGLLTDGDIAEVYSQTLAQGMQVAAQFVLERDKTWIANLTALAQAKQANIQALLAEAEILMLPSKMELAYAQVEVQRKQIELLQYQIEVQKAQIPKEAAQIDQIHAQTDLICVQRKQALEALAQSDLDRKLKELQINSGSVDLQIKEHQANQAQINTQTALVQLRLLKGQVKQLVIDSKLKAQQLLKEKEQQALIKAQTATAYASVTATAEAIKAAKAQYSDTIDGEPVGGVLGAQMAVNKMQVEAFDRDGFYKLASTVKDGWNAKKTSDIATLSPNAFTAFGVDRVIAAYAQKFNMPENTFELPSNYTDYLSDAEMDGTAPTPSTSNSTVKP